MLKNIFLALLFFAIVIPGKGQKKDFVVTIHTKYGKMIALLYDETPKHKANFIKLAKAHYFDSLLFHRVIAGFMIQGGDPNSKKAKPGQSLGNGGPGYTIDAEFNPKFFHKKGALSAARLGDAANPTKASSGSQFYIVQGTVLTSDNADELKFDQEKLNTGLQQFISKPVHQSLRDTLGQLYSAGDVYKLKKKIFSLAPQIEKETGLKISKEVSPEKIQAYTTVGGTPFLDGGYTVFGEVIQGFEIIDKIAMEKKNGADRPLEDVVMIVSVEELSKKKITKLYGYQFPEIKK